jgi:DNA-directed RNA polymerase subunit L
MKKRIFGALASSLETCDKPIEIGAEQSLVTIKDALSSIEEGRGEVETEQANLDTLEDASEALESIAVAVRQQIREGGMTPAIAYTHTLAMEQVLTDAKIAVESYVISHEAFANDRISVSLEAERSAKEAAKEVADKITASVKRIFSEMEKYIKSFKVVSKNLKKHATELKANAKGLKKPEGDVTVDITELSKHFHQGGKFDGNVDAVLTRVSVTGDKLAKYSKTVKGVVDKLIDDASKGNYNEGDYLKALDKALVTIAETDLPGGYTLKKDKESKSQVVLIKDDSAKPETRSIDLPDSSRLSSICDKVIKIADFIDEYNVALTENEAELQKLIRSAESSPDSANLTSLGVLGADMSKIMSAVRGAGPDYIRYSAICGKEALNFVSTCIKQHA